MRNPTVSVIIPCYNDEGTVGETLESLKQQTFYDWEAIVVNDGSTDGSGEIVQHYQDSDSRIYRIDQENGGLAAARNAGLSTAKGEFINFLDADDLLLPDMLKRMVQKLREDATCDAVNCGWIFSDAETQDLSWVGYPSHEGQLFEQLAHRNLFPCHSILIHRNIFKNVGEFDCSLRHCHDWDLWLRVARAGTNFACIYDPLVIYRMRVSSLSRNPLTFFEAEKEVLRRGHGPDPRLKKSVTEFTQGCNCSMREAIKGRLLNNVALTIVQGDTIQASELFERTLEDEGLDITPKDMKLMACSLFFGAAIPSGNWDALWQVISHPLLQFLLRQEKHLRMPGFAMQSIFEMVGWNKLQRRSNVELKPRHKLLRYIKKKILQCTLK